VEIGWNPWGMLPHLLPQGPDAEWPDTLAGVTIREKVERLLDRLSEDEAVSDLRADSVLILVGLRCKPAPQRSSQARS
jgi:hypothetical protein